MTTATQPITAQSSVTRTPQAHRAAIAAVAAVNMRRIPLQQSAVLHDTPGVLGMRAEAVQSRRHLL
ncbi:hypothetical protein [Streptomyces canus]|uniref:hypothetical protein n=1 Tax=Streptomyces canus TaxID=58343 RepID=UPI002DD924AE|nr:hypothetical protein [Streptomyces canus]WSD83464.1 hypothetical protein OG925_03815 [Streptomyces canus]